MGHKVFFRDNGFSPVKILHFWFKGKKINIGWPQLSSGRLVYTHLGRSGNVFICELLNIQKGDEILVPSYNCGSEVDPFLWYGMNAVMYRIDKRLRIDVEDLKKRLSNKTRIIYVTHYFGWPQALDELRSVCDQHNLFLIEDCALSLFSNGTNGVIGLTGDASIHSFRKTLPVPDGAALVLKSKFNNLRVPKSRPKLIIVKETIPLILRWLINLLTKYFHINYFISHLEKRFRNKKSVINSSVYLDMPKDFYFDKKVLPKTLSRISIGILNSTDINMVFEKRRSNYSKLYNGICDLKNVKPMLGPLPDGVCPLLLPITVLDTRYWIDELNKCAIKSTTWWEGFHRKLNWQNFPEAKYLKQNLVVLPVHQYLNDEDINYIITCVKDIDLKLN